MHHLVCWVPLAVEHVAQDRVRPETETRRSRLLRVNPLQSGGLAQRLRCLRARENPVTVSTPNVVFVGT